MENCEKQNDILNYRCFSYVPSVLFRFENFPTKDNWYLGSIWLWSFTNYGRLGLDGRKEKRFQYICWTFVMCHQLLHGDVNYVVEGFIRILSAIAQVVLASFYEVWRVGKMFMTWDTSFMGFLCNWTSKKKEWFWIPFIR